MITVLTQSTIYDEWAHIVWSSAESRNDVKIIYDTIWQYNSFLRRLHKIHHFMKLPLKGVWIKKYLSEIPLSKKEKNIIFIKDVSIYTVNEKFIKYLQKNFSAKVILYTFNPIKRKGGKGYIGNVEIEKLKRWYDLVIVCDPDDASKYKLDLILEIYSKIDFTEAKESKKDLLFVGREKGREGLIESIYQVLKFYDINVEIDICGKGKERGDGWNYIEYIPYGQIIEKVRESNCILEVLQKGQSGMTQRTMEALVYNKKLLTNNKHIVEMPFYNKDYIQVFEKPEDIDVNFITERIAVDYGYRDEYSASAFLDKAIELLKIKEQGK